MNTDIVQRLRYKLQKRARKVNSAGYQTFHFALQRWWGFLHSNELLLGILEQLADLVPTAKEDAERIINGERLHGESEEEESSLAYWIIKLCIEPEDVKDREIYIAHSYSQSGNHNEALEIFKDMFVDPLYEYIDEQIDDQRAVLGLLRRYKHTCEWFQRNDLLDIYQKEVERGAQEGKKGRGEKQLALHLYEYLYNQGLSFSIEPTSVSGEADLIDSQNTDDPLIADIKLFDPSSSKNKSYIIKGFQQVYQYTLDFNEPFGYLVIFKTCEDGLAISAANQEQSTSFVTVNGKTIFIVIIDLYPHDKSASKRGKLKIHTISEDELVTQITEDQEALR
ncbi:hypothetical protein F1728_06520 [Gimesia benthica]|uniref:Uncharacterized protein n=1 Tax=Gimesia benthica TaxID=2608982 RepID=A0A6I6A8C0_9PLAN|nr:hypothetical protein [Gimesia benthica]QGQ22346.1 hypothetical protein F1728_06520 [Gimesia benthica]